MDRLFLDANVLFSAAYRANSGLRQFWKLKNVALCSSHYALEEARINLAQDLQKRRLEKLTKAVELFDSIPHDLPRDVTLPGKDVPILVAPLAARATHLITGDVSGVTPSSCIFVLFYFYTFFGLIRQGHPMNVKDFRRIALSFEGAEESSHMGAPDFRVGGRIFATLASQHQGYGNLQLTLEQQAAFVEELPDVFLPIPGGWGRMGMTHIRLAAASEDVLRGALHAAWKLRLEKNARAKKGRPRHARRAKTKK
jgi:predicted nucleic acid-binding protein